MSSFPRYPTVKLNWDIEENFSESYGSFAKQFPLKHDSPSKKEFHCQIHLESAANTLFL